MNFSKKDYLILIIYKNEKAIFQKRRIYDKEVPDKSIKNYQFFITKLSSILKKPRK